MHSAQEAKRALSYPAESQKPSKISKSQEEDEGEEKEREGDQGIMSPNPRVQRYLLAIEYIGSRFFGSQKQPNFRTVTGTLEDAFLKFVGQPVSIVCSSRTIYLPLVELLQHINLYTVTLRHLRTLNPTIIDTGVHALCNVCHVDVERISKRKPGEVLTPHESGVVRRAVNHFLQKEGDIMVTDVRRVPRDFHARFKALDRTYFYRLVSGPEPLSTFEKERAWHVPEELNVLEMKKACNILIGCHDFSSFRASGCQASSPIRTLDELHICEVVPSSYFPSNVEGKEMNFESSADNSVASDMHVKSLGATSTREFGHKRSHHCYVITARSRSFLYHQVRLLVGLLKSVGTGEVPTSEVEEILDAKSVTAASPMAPACGLYLGNVKYDLPDDLER